MEGRCSQLFLLCKISQSRLIEETRMVIKSFLQHLRYSKNKITELFTHQKKLPGAEPRNSIFTHEHTKKMTSHTFAVVNEMWYSQWYTMLDSAYNITPLASSVGTRKMPKVLELSQVQCEYKKYKIWKNLQDPIGPASGRRVKFHCWSSNNSLSYREFALKEVN